YKYGIARMYRDLNLPVVPVAMHPGLFWPRRSIRRYPGHFKVRILPPIMPGMDPDAFFAHLIEVSERASDELLLETVERNPHLPLPPTAVERLVELRKLNAATA
ncbi:1-acyl-sn-glycerol-3-phosphate acyltransferase, partial [Rhizobium ruizarguesonis]